VGYEHEQVWAAGVARGYGAGDLVTGKGTWRDRSFHNASVYLWAFGSLLIPYVAVAAILLAVRNIVRKKPRAWFALTVACVAPLLGIAFWWWIASLPN
jgi:hypothetical protein